MTNNLDELFAPQVKIEEEKQKKVGEYNVSADKGKNGVYKAIIRFIPWWKDPSNSIKSKFTCWLKDPLTDKGRYVDDPASINEPSILNEAYWKCKNSESASLQEQAARFSRKQTYAALIQVIKDENQPELNGKILVWRFGKKIQDKINSEMNPPIGDPKNPWDLINGRYFALTVTKVSGYNNYDNSQFVDFKNSGLQMYSEDGKLVEIVSSSSNKTQVFEYLKLNSPDLDEYNFKPWTKDISDYVNHVVSLVLQPAGTAAMMANAYNVNPNSSTTVNRTAPNITISTSLDEMNSDTNKQLGNLNIDDLELGNIPSVSTNENNSPMGNLDDIFNSI